MRTSVARNGLLIIIATTEWQLNPPLLTRNQKHFRIITEIKLAPIYPVECVTAIIR